MESKGGLPALVGWFCFLGRGVRPGGSVNSKSGRVAAGEKQPASAGFIPVGMEVDVHTAHKVNFLHQARFYLV